ncbi:MAG: hypothetical protein ACOCYO_02335 [Bacteroidota bacterium]
MSFIINPILSYSFITDYPWWFYLLCLLAGAIAALGLYYKNPKNNLTSWQKKLLAALRFFAVAGICFLLLSPLIQLQTSRTEEPLVLFFQDNSLSVATTSDTTFLQNQYSTELQELDRKLNDPFDFSMLAFGQEVRQTDDYDFNDPLTNFSEIFNYIENLYANRNLGAIVIASDGRFNRGSNPLYTARKFLFPVYTVALGDTTPQKDILIRNINHNRITYLDNIFPVEILIEGKQAAGNSTNLRIFHENDTVFSQNINFSSDGYFEEIMVELKADETGVKRYTVELEEIKDEISVANNVQEFFIEVIDSRQKVLILANSPHPDVGTLKTSVERNDNFETEVSILENFKGSIDDFDVIIWHQIPSAQHKNHRLLEQAKELEKPQLFVLGSQTDIEALNALSTGLSLEPRSEETTGAQAEPNLSFPLFQLSEDLIEILTLYPPLSTPFARYNHPANANILAMQRIGNVPTNMPLIIFTEDAENKIAHISGEGLWRWRMNNFARKQHHREFDELISKIIQYLSVIEDKSFFRVHTENFVYENEPVVFEAELYNKSYELVNTPDVNLTITNEEGVDYDYVFSKTFNAYTLDAGTFPVGNYTYTATTRLGQETYTEEGLFTVAPLNLEDLNTVADHTLLFQLADNSGGKMFFPDQMDELTEDLLNRDDIKPMLFPVNEYKEIVNMRWIFFILLLFLTIEWFIRKYTGGY